MKSDLSRPTFNETRHYTRLLFQQARPPLDADFNEQNQIQLEMLRSYARDIIGEHGGTTGAFEITLPTAPGFKNDAPDFAIAAGHYYVDGLLCESDVASSYAKPLFPLPFKEPTTAAFPALAYLDVWEHHRTWIDDGVIIDPALGGSDTSTRSRIVWQVRLLTEDGLEALGPLADEELAKLGLADLKKNSLKEIANHNPKKKNFQDGVAKKALEVTNRNRGLLRVRIKPGAQDDDCCKAHTETRYRGVENQLYRVEIHRRGAALPADAKPNDEKNDPDGSKYAKQLGDAATFKWSRENGSVAAKWLPASDCGAPGSLVLRILGPRDQAHGFAPGQWIEVTDETRELRGEPGVFARLARVEGDTLTLDPPADALPAWKDLTNPKVRRWDQQDIGDNYFEKGTIAVRENAAEPDKDPWIDLENGLQIQFVRNGKTPPTYRTGDYWTIPVRVATGGLLWPWNDPPATVDTLPPHGIEHHYAPLALITAAQDIISLRRKLKPIAEAV